MPALSIDGIGCDEGSSISGLLTRLTVLVAGLLAANCLPDFVVGVGGRDDEAATEISFLPSLEGGRKDLWSALLMAWFVGFLPLVEEDATVTGFASLEGVVASTSRISFGSAA